MNLVTKVGIRGRGEKLRIAATITIFAVKQKGQLHILSGVVRSLVMILNPGGLKICKESGKNPSYNFDSRISLLLHTHYYRVARIGK